MLYNIAGRTGVNIETPTLLRLAEIPNIIAVKEASGNIAQIAEVCARVPEDFQVFSGDDSITLAVIGLGGAGIVSVVSNEIPAEMTRLTRAALANNWDTARSLFKKYLPLMQGQLPGSQPLPRQSRAGHDGPGGRNSAPAAGSGAQRDSQQAGENRGRSGTASTTARERELAPVPGCRQQRSVQVTSRIREPICSPRFALSKMTGTPQTLSDTSSAVIFDFHSS